MSRHRGSCLCGSIQFEFERSYLSAVNCYCSLCRRAHGGAFSTHIAMRSEQFRLIKGELKVFSASTEGRRAFCEDCGSHVLVHGQIADDSVAVPAGLCEKDTSVEVTAHIFVRDKVAWYRIEDGLPQYDGWPPGVVATHVD